MKIHRLELLLRKQQNSTDFEKYRKTRMAQDEKVLLGHPELTANADCHPKSVTPR